MSSAASRALSLGVGFEMGSQTDGPPMVNIYVEELADPDRVVVHFGGRCLCTATVGGAVECFSEMLSVWAEAGSKSMSERSGVLWKWWKEDGHKKDYETTKLWMLVESLDGSLHSAAIPSAKLASALMGMLCGTRRDILRLVFSEFNEDNSVQVPD